MVDANWTVGHTERPAGFIYRRSYVIASYKNANRVNFDNYYQIFVHFYSDRSIS
jgi:hypothetical protein